MSVWGKQANRNRQDSAGTRTGRLWPKRAGLLVGIALGVSGVFVGAGEAPAHASEVCVWPFCGEVYNNSPWNVTAARDWCNSSEKYVGNTLPCDPPNRRGHKAYYDSLPHRGDHTPEHQDWDAFRVDAHWKYTYRVWTVGRGWGPNKVVDRRGHSTGEWIRVHDNQTAEILSQVS